MSFRMPSQIMQHTWAAIVVGVVSIGAGVYTKARANKKTKDALKNRKAYQTPDEVFRIANALENRSQGDTQTRDYQTQELDNAFSQQLEMSELLGADPNDLSAMFQQRMNGILQIGKQFHASNMEAFGNTLKGWELVANNKAAEQGSADNLIKDQLAALAAQKAQGDSLINTGINSGITGVSSLAMGQLYKDPNPAKEDKLLFKDEFGQNSGAYRKAKKNKMSFEEYQAYYNKMEDESW